MQTRLYLSPPCGYLVGMAASTATPNRSALHDTIVAELLRDLRHDGWLATHISDSRKLVTRNGRKILAPDQECAGVPDITALHPATGRRVMVEVKTGAGELTAKQSEWLEAGRECGFEVFVTRPENLSMVRQALFG